MKKRSVLFWTISIVVGSVIGYFAYKKIDANRYSEIIHEGSFTIKVK